MTTIFERKMSTLPEFLPRYYQNHKTTKIFLKYIQSPITSFTHSLSHFLSVIFMTSNRDLVFRNSILFGRFNKFLLGRADTRAL